MRRRVGSFIRSLVVGGVALVALTAAGPGHSAAPVPTSDKNASAGPAVTALPPEVRLRKLHLVRPDLIPYPIAYEVVC